MQIAQDGGVVVVATPYDKRLAEINARWRPHGRWGERDDARTGQGASNAGAPKAGWPTGPEAGPAGADESAAADRAGFCRARPAGRQLRPARQHQESKVKLEELKKDELPNELKKMTPKEQKEYLQDGEGTREALNKAL